MLSRCPMPSNVANCDRYEIQPMHSMMLPESLTGFSVPLLPNANHRHELRIETEPSLHVLRRMSQTLPIV